ncbi:hypothetical protein_gp193 [Bacillus phage vB_BceM_WH1]|nr:hypothetical protein_gp193 [Bacillus phage vB_BceM_WH1]
MSNELLPVGAKVTLLPTSDFAGQDYYREHGERVKAPFGIIVQQVGRRNGFAYHIDWYTKDGRKFYSDAYTRHCVKAVVVNNDDTLLLFKSDEINI